MTLAGLAQRQRLGGVLVETQDALLARLSGDEREELGRLLTRVLDHHLRR